MLRFVTVDIMIAGISQIEVVNLRNTSLNRDQIIGIYRMVADNRNGRMKIIKLGGNHVPSSISPDLCKTSHLNQSIRII